jgi:hypothetical protein
MHDTQEVFHLLSIAKLAHEWQELHPIRNRALEKLKEIAKEPAHKEPEHKEPERPTARPVSPPRPIRSESNG